MPISLEALIARVIALLYTACFFEGDGVGLAGELALFTAVSCEAGLFLTEAFFTAAVFVTFLTAAGFLTGDGAFFAAAFLTAADFLTGGEAFFAAAFLIAGGSFMAAGIAFLLPLGGMLTGSVNNEVQWSNVYARRTPMEETDLTCKQRGCHNLALECGICNLPVCVPFLFRTLS